MPYAENDGVKLFWEETGVGEPVLLIMGLGWASYLWNRTRKVLAEKYRVITFDNRGVGRSDVPEGPYPIPTMASDAAAVLDAAGVKSAHIFGISMGGMIAQEFAINYPDRVKSLILGCTAAGGPAALQPAPEVLQVLMRRGMTPQEAAEAIDPFIYHPDASPELKDEELKLRMEWYPTPEGYLSQLQGIMMWEAYSRIGQIKAPTLVLHGDVDQLIPAGNGKLIAERIPNAKLVTIAKASHIFPTDQPEITREALLTFLAAQHS
ncbi:MAG TPA: alpha/beta fold hydrolase [Candidatus Acidoferrales bacterium]